jgi:hypothetical protein
MRKSVFLLMLLPSLAAAQTSAHYFPRKVGVMTKTVPSALTVSGGIRGDTLRTPNYFLPVADGSNGQVLTTNGSGAISWQTPAAGSEVDGVIGNEVTGGKSDSTLSRSGSGTADNPYRLGIKLSTANTWAGKQTFSDTLVAGSALRVEQAARFKSTVTIGTTGNTWSLPTAPGSSGQFLSYNGTWAAPSGGGDVLGPATNSADYIPQWNGANSKTLKNGLAIGTSAGTIAAGDHTHTGSTLSGIDISDDTNLSASGGVSLSGDALSHSTADGYKHIPSTGASAQLLQYSSAGTAKWITLSGDATIADGGAVTVADDSHAHVYSDIDATTSSNWAGRVTDETGSGSMVFGTSPTFTGSVGIPYDNNPTTDASGEIAIDSNGSGIEYYDGTASRFINDVESYSFTLLEPDLAAAKCSLYPLYKFSSAAFPQGATIISLNVACKASVTDTVTFIEQTTAAGGTTSTIEAVSCSAAETDVTSNIDDTAIAAGSWCAVNIGTEFDNVETVTFTIVFRKNCGN